MRPVERAAELRRRISYLTAFIEAGDALTAQSDNLQTWREELEAQGFGEHDVPDILYTDATWLRTSGRTPEDLLDELKAELPKAEQLAEENRIEVARHATSERFWDLRMALAWIRFRDVENACRLLERRDANELLRRGDEVVETHELEQRLARGEVVCAGVQDGVLREISSAEWTRGSQGGLRLTMKDGAIYAGRSGERARYTGLRFARQQLQHAFPRLDALATTDGPALAAARNILRRATEPMKSEHLWSEVSKVLGETVSKGRRERLQKELRKDFADRFLKGAPKKPKLPSQ